MDFLSPLLIKFSFSCSYPKSTITSYHTNLLKKMYGHTQTIFNIKLYITELLQRSPNEYNTID